MMANGNDHVRTEWVAHKLDQLGTVGRGKSKHRPRDDSRLFGGPYPFVQTGDVKKANFYLTDYEQTYSAFGLAQSKLWDPGTLCITIAANIAETAILGMRACFPDSVVGFVADPDKADVRFIKYYIDAIKLNVQAISHGTTQDNLSLEKLLQLDFIVPPIALQYRIAAALSAYDELIENCQRRIRILDDMARALYREWFVRLRFPGYERARTANSSLGRIPSEWQVVRVGDIATKIGSGSTPRGGEAAYHQEGVTLIRSLNVYDNSFKDDGLAFLDEDQATALSNVSVEAEDILLNITGASVARCCMAPTRHLPARVNQHVMIIRINRALADPYFVLSTINSEERKRQLLAYAHAGATREALTKETVSNFEILLPDRALLERFSVIARDIFRQHEVLSHQSGVLRKTRNLLLPRLLSGQIPLEGPV